MADNMKKKIELDVNRLDVREVPIEKIQIGEFCKRDSYDNLDSLESDIRKNGLLQFPAVTDNGDDGYTLIFGSQRYYVYKRLGKKNMPCRIIEASPGKAAMLSFAENCSRSNLSQVEQAKKLCQMKTQLSLTDTQLADAIGWPQSRVTEHLGILRLSEDILEAIDSRPESPFKFTHALALSKLEATGRSRKKIEIGQLKAKTIECKLLSSELKQLVQIFKKGMYEHLPNSLQMRLLKSKHMDAKMARLYLKPEDAIEGDSKDAVDRRKTAPSLCKKQLEKLLVNAVKAGWSYKETCEKLCDLVSSQLRPNANKNVQPQLSSQMLSGNISALQSRLEVSIKEIPDVTKYNHEQLKMLLQKAEPLLDELERFCEVVKDTLKATLHKQGIQIKEHDDVSIS